ncbi:hypothetical protein OESDEN_22721 [Oesophagostomum dentatum]|uniref:ZP domain-containing protein n=1 Tax=Oesophagostomum dentatum TaxID=61180 RepID=A0A0B1RYC4_OESDE|nr:hypothetical protein OESDEN_22721 [Oesophagostomum dentatum]
MPELTYSDDLTRSFTAASAFNFPDQQSVYFNCQVRICYKLDDGCANITPPRCGFISSQDDTLASDLDNDQLISSNDNDDSFECYWIPDPRITAKFHERCRNKGARTVLNGRGSIAEGSGLEIARPTPVSLIRAGHIPEHPGEKVESDVVQLRREMRRRDAEAIDVDITSPELTIIDKDIAAELPEALQSTSAPAPSPSVCVPLIGFWLLAALIVLCCSIIAASLCYAQKQRDKFHIMP